MATSDMDCDDNETPESVTARSYQVEIMEQAKSENLIVCLPTGSGKTFIAIMLIKELSPDIRGSLKDGKKRTILLVKTGELARQHYNMMINHLGKPEDADLKTGIYTGASKINLQDSKRWNDELENHHVLIFTAQIFLNLLSHNHFSLDKVNLLIIDECHHATGNDQYAVIMKEYYQTCLHPPRILGLTASISGQKIEPDKLQKAAKELENTLQARIETGSDQMEITRHSTSVKVKHHCCSNYEQKICQKRKPIMDIFKTIKSLSDTVDKYLKSKKDKKRTQHEPMETNNLLNDIQFQCQTIDQLKSHLQNIIHVGYDLGLYGLSLAIKSLVDHQKSTNAFRIIIDQEEKQLYEEILNKLEYLINNSLTNLPEDDRILYSDKILQAKPYIAQNQTGQSIVFVERIFTAAFLSQVFKKIFPELRIEYLAGSKVAIDGTSISNKNLRKTAEDFRENQIHVLVSTAIIEEGLDVKTCNLVIRFNKPQNFSSYLQSKGRARAKNTDAFFVLLNDGNDLEAFSMTKRECESYEYMEKWLKRSFKSHYYEDVSLDDDSLDTLEPYRPGNGVRINGMHAVRIVYHYCSILGKNQILSPRFCFYLKPSEMFQCVLTMPRNCFITDDVICLNKNKKLAKQECCLKMVKELHKNGKLDEKCLPIRRKEDTTTDEDSDEDTGDNDDNKKEKTSGEIYDQQIAYFPQKHISISTLWHLYRIEVSANVNLGFIVPSEINKLPIFQLYECEQNECRVKLIYLKPIDFNECQCQLKSFCQYIFEEVFDKMNTGLRSILQFDIDNSPYKLLPCLLKESGDIDYERMSEICNRKNKSVEDQSELKDNEVYYASHLTNNELYMNISDEGFLKNTSDRWDCEQQSEKTNETYADRYERKIPDIHIQRNNPMATMKHYSKSRINYMTGVLLKKDKKSSIVSEKFAYFPIELIRYAPLNQTDYELIYKLPSILIRIAHLHYIEELRKSLSISIQSYSLLNVDHVQVVTFGDCLLNIFSTGSSTALPLVYFDYNSLLNNFSECRLSSDLLFQSLTRHSTDEKTDMENLEILGDCFLKLAMSMSLYHRYPSYDAGELTSKKDRQVSNKNLYQLATKKDLKKYLYATRMQYRGKQANWLPPGYKTDGESSERYMTQKSKRKAFADMIEALIGTFLVSTDYGTTLKFMQWLGLPVIPRDEQDKIMKTPSILYSSQFNTMSGIADSIHEIYLAFSFCSVEKTLHYDFKNKGYLIAACTHASYYNNRVTQCYERLEYLGDAVLDFLLIRYIFVKYYNRVTPNHVTDIRQDLSNNGRLAYICTTRDLHTKILHLSTYLYNQITIYCGDKSLFPKKDHSSKDKLNNDIDQWADSTAPKALADVFEALVGAIFLDSGYSLKIVWDVIEPLLRDYIKRAVEHPILNPIRAVSERQGKFLEQSKDATGRCICVVQLPNGAKFEGYGKNKKLAKLDACRTAAATF